MRILGIDYGTRSVGLALSDESHTIALPYKTVSNTKELFAQLQGVITSESVGIVVVGHSMDQWGKDNVVMEDVYRFVQELQSDTSLEIVLEPEAFTSMHARESAPRDINASAAALILQRYLDRKKRENPSV